MPRRDGTGPMGMGAKTGRGAGYCNTAVNVNSNQIAYFGGNGCGNKRGNRRQFFATGLPGCFRNNFSQNNMEMDEKSFLSQQEALLENQLKQVKERISEMKEETE